MNGKHARNIHTAIRRLNAELAMRQLDGGAGTVGIALGALIAATAGVAFYYSFGRGPVTPVVGVVEAFGFTESEHGSRLRATVWVDDRRATVSIHGDASCAVGDRIMLNRRRAWIGYRYGARLPRACD